MVLVLYGMRLSKRFRVSHVWIFAVALLGLGLLRDYMAFLVVLGLAIGSVTAVPSGTHVRDDVVRYHGRADVDLLCGSGWPFYGHTPRGTSRDSAGSAGRTTAGCYLCVRRGSGDPYHRSGSRIHTDRVALTCFLPPFPWAVRNPASGDGEVGDAPLVSSFPGVDSRVPNHPPRSLDHGVLSHVRASDRRVELCPGGGKLRYGVSASGPDHAALLRFFGRRPLLDQGPDHQPVAVVAD